MLFLQLLLCASFVYSSCSRTYGASSRELGERHASCDILLCLLLQLGCCECFYVLPLLLLMLLMLLLSVLRLL